MAHILEDMRDGILFRREHGPNKKKDKKKYKRVNKMKRDSKKINRKK